MKVEIRQSPFNPYQEIENFQSTLDISGRFGATASFVGTMRDLNNDQQIQGMTIEHYPAMTEKHINEICNQASEKWSLLEILVIHRIGEIKISDAIIVIAVWAVHRGDAQDACRFILEDLKSKAPFWKKEKLEHGESWVEGNTSGYLKGEV